MFRITVRIRSLFSRGQIGWFSPCLHIRLIRFARAAEQQPQRDLSIRKKDMGQTVRARLKLTFIPNSVVLTVQSRNTIPYVCWELVGWQDVNKTLSLAFAEETKEFESTIKTSFNNPGKILLIKHIWWKHWLDKTFRFHGWTMNNHWCVATYTTEPNSSRHSSARLK